MISFSMPLEKKTVLTPEEAETYTGIDINRLWQMSNEPDCNFVIREGKKLLFKRKQLMVYIKIKGSTLSLRKDAEFGVIAQKDRSAKLLGSMGEYKKLNHLLQENNGYILTYQVADAGIDMTAFYNFVERMSLTKADTGVYVLPELYKDKMYMLHLSFGNAVFSHDTALFLHGLIDKAPTVYTATTKNNCDECRMRRFGLLVFTLPEYLLKIGVTQLQSPLGNWIPVYDMERTICDLVHDQGEGQMALVENVLVRYVAKENKSIGRLMKYAEIFRVEKEIRHHLMKLSRKGVVKL